MAVDDSVIGKANQNYPVRDEITGEIVSDPDGFPIAELESADYFELGSSMTIEERSAGERAWRFGHVIVDEAQDLTPMQWRMIARRARGHSMTIVGDVAQRTTGAPGSWTDLLPPELGDVNRFDLSTNYRSPDEVSSLAAAVLRELDPTLISPISIRSSGHDVAVVHSEHLVREMQQQAMSLVDDVDDGRVAVLGCEVGPIDHHQIRCLTPAASKGMEFDAVVVVEPAEILECEHGLGLLYVAVTRTTDRLVLLHNRPLPSVLLNCLAG